MCRYIIHLDVYYKGTNLFIDGSLSLITIFLPLDRVLGMRGPTFVDVASLSSLSLLSLSLSLSPSLSLSLSLSLCFASLMCVCMGSFVRSICVTSFRSRCAKLLPLLLRLLIRLLLRCCFGSTCSEEGGDTTRDVLGKHDSF